MYARKLLADLQQRVEDRIDRHLDAEHWEHVSVTNVGDRIRVDFYGCPFDESYADLLQVLAHPEVAQSVAALSLDGPDEGANGTCNWDLTALAEAPVTFGILQALSVKRSAPEDHNHSIVAADYAEEGVLARLLTKCPQLKSLHVPSAPSAAFFDRAPHTLQRLSVDAGYDTQDFIRNLSNSRCFPHLTWLDWGEFHQTYLDNWRSQCTPSEQYRQLFLSAAFESVGYFRWRNPLAAIHEIEALKRSKPGLQLHVVRTHADYIP